MQFRFLPPLLLVGLTALGAARGFAQATSPGAQPAGRIIAARVQGEVLAIAKATHERIPLANGAEVAPGASVTTAKGASVVLVFSNGATINLGAESEMDIETFTQDPFDTAFDAADAKEEPTTSTTKLKLTRGELVAKVATLHPTQGSSFVVNTAVGAAGVRGTIFRIVYRFDETGKVAYSMTTLEGSVAVTLASGTVTNPPVEVNANTEISVTADITTDASGNITVTLPSGATTTVATEASANSLQQVTDAATQIAQAIADIVITPPPATPGSKSTQNTPAEGEKSSETENKTPAPQSKTPAKTETPNTTPVTLPTPGNVIVSPSSTK